LQAGLKEGGNSQDERLPRISRSIDGSSLISQAYFCQSNKYGRSERLRCTVSEYTALCVSSRANLGPCLLLVRLTWGRLSTRGWSWRCLWLAGARSADVLRRNVWLRCARSAATVPRGTAWLGSPWLAWA